LEVLQAAALKVGVDVRSDVRLETVAQLAEHGLDDADLVVGADGVNSVVRNGNEAAFHTRRSYLTNRFAWFGVGKAFPTPALVFRQFDGGAFVAHYYPYTSESSTFVAECDQATWEKFDLESKSLDERKALYEMVFASELGGFPLLSNNSLWRQFPVIRNDNWVVGNTVLIGDAQTSAHFSIGSGTRIAIEDSIALAEAVCGICGTVAEKLAGFVAKRRPEKDKLISASERSYDWYENVAQWMAQYTPEEFVYRFMTRTGRVSDERLASAFPKLYAQLLAAKAVPAHADA
jgi:2-polyprenyl-6-methoxyphenol hydroxylase-like FAD-dependent oxidoreductase